MVEGTCRSPFGRGPRASMATWWSPGFSLLSATAWLKAPVVRPTDAALAPRWQLIVEFGILEGRLARSETSSLIKAPGHQKGSALRSCTSSEFDAFVPFLPLRRVCCALWAGIFGLRARVLATLPWCPVSGAPGPGYAARGGMAHAPHTFGSRRPRHKAWRFSASRALQAARCSASDFIFFEISEAAVPSIILMMTCD